MDPSLSENGVKSNRRISPGITTTFVYLACWWCVDAFNIDTTYPIRFVGPPKSYFGYSIALLNNSKGNWVIVGAPRANTTSFATLNEPGEIFKCNLETRNCSRVELDKIAQSEDYENGEEYRENKENMWLGVSVDTTPAKGGRVVACAHLWKNVVYRNAHLVNGACYALDKEFRQDTMQKFIPLLSAADQIVDTDVYKFAFAQLGISAHFIKNSDALLLGASGIWDWKGSSVFLSRDGFDMTKRPDADNYADAVVPNPINELHNTAYFGYAVTSGQFSKNGPVMLAIGAPRQNFAGKIYIVEIKNNRYIQKVDKTGEKMGEYFGAALCAVDLNNDNLDDLLVGAPMHFKYLDEGKVYVFINKGNALFQLSQESLMGSQKVGARFGSTIAVIGDVNMDGYLDVAIGAPYENDRGAVYIYHGNANGLKSQYQQKIEARHGSATTRGFGVSIARGMDLDGNQYPDLAIGAYASSETFIFRTSPVIYLSGSVTSSLSQLNMDVKNCTLGSRDVSCFILDVCISYDGKFVPGTLDINYSLQVDSFKESETNGTRVFLKSNTKMTNQIQEKATLLLQKPNCQKYNVYALDAPKDYMTPIQMLLTYQMVPRITPLPEFCTNCPLQDHLENNKKIAQVRFMKNCGADEKCDTDLKLTAFIQDLSLQDVFAIGSKDSLILLAEIFNAAEPAYATRLTVDIPSWMTINKKRSVCEFTINNPHQVLCMVANPLLPREKETYEFELNLEKIPVDNGLISIQVTVRSDSNEDNSKLKDNNVTLEFQTKAVADASITGSTHNEQAFYEQTDQGKILESATALFSHAYEVYNNGPSPIHQVIVKMKYPASSLDGQTKLMQIMAIDTRDGQHGAAFGSCDAKIAEQSASPATSKPGDGKLTLQLNNRKRRAATDNPDSSTAVILKDAFILDCSTALCETISCIVGPFTKDDSASLAVTFAVNVFNLSSIMGKKDAATIFTEVQITIGKDQVIVQPDVHKPDFAKVSTDIKSGGAPPPKQLASWIIPVSICGGILLFVLLTVALVKLGFFRRKTKEEMKRLIAEGEGSTVPNQQDSAEMEG